MAYSNKEDQCEISDASIDRDMAAEPRTCQIFITYNKLWSELLSMTLNFRNRVEVQRHSLLIPKAQKAITTNASIRGSAKKISRTWNIIKKLLSFTTFIAFVFPN
jgi:hypothetical protein